jgi:hypothetical protein
MHKKGRDAHAEGVRRGLRVLRIWQAKSFGEPTKEQIHLFAKTRKPCSGPCCGNPRKHFGKKTVRELHAEETAE